MDHIYQLKYLCSVVLHLRDVYILVLLAYKLEKGGGGASQTKQLVIIGMTPRENS